MNTPTNNSNADTVLVSHTHGDMRYRQKHPTQGPTGQRIKCPAKGGTLSQAFSAGCYSVSSRDT